jgi:hypothetical protein
MLAGLAAILDLIPRVDDPVADAKMDRRGLKHRHEGRLPTVADDPGRNDLPRSGGD